MVAVRARRRGKTAPAASPRPAPCPAVGVDEEQRRHLIECCAFFRAQRFREASPGRYREEDLRAAASAIDSVIGPARRSKRR